MELKPVKAKALIWPNETKVKIITGPLGEQMCLEGAGEAYQRLRPPTQLHL